MSGKDTEMKLSSTAENPSVAEHSINPELALNAAFFGVNSPPVPISAPRQSRIIVPPIRLPLSCTVAENAPTNRILLERNASSSANAINVFPLQQFQMHRQVQDLALALSPVYEEQKEAVLGSNKGQKIDHS